MTQSFPWYKSYPAGVPHEINPDRYPSIPAVLIRRPRLRFSHIMK